MRINRKVKYQTEAPLEIKKKLLQKSKTVKPMKLQKKRILTQIKPETLSQDMQTKMKVIQATSLLSGLDLPLETLYQNVTNNIQRKFCIEGTRANFTACSKSKSRLQMLKNMQKQRSDTFEKSFCN